MHEVRIVNLVGHGFRERQPDSLKQVAISGRHETDLSGASFGECSAFVIVEVAVSLTGRVVFVQTQESVTPLDNHQRYVVGSGIFATKMFPLSEDRVLDRIGALAGEVFQGGGPTLTNA